MKTLELKGLPSQIMLTTTPIWCCDNHKGTSNQGTGFFYRFDFNEVSISCIISNKHVLNYGDNCIFNLRICLDRRNHIYSPKTQKIEIKNHKKYLILHRDPRVDLACLLLVPEILTKHLKSDIIMSQVEPSSVVTDERLSDFPTLFNVITAGYPKGIFDKENNIPIFRKGYTSTPPSLKLDGKNEFYVDVPVFGGCSGSPVFLYDTDYIERNRKEKNLRLLLVGILARAWLPEQEARCNPDGTSKINPGGLIYIRFL